MDLEIVVRAPERESTRPLLLFVHGAFHAAWCWDRHLLPWFADRGYRAAAVSLRGHGGSDGREGIANWRLSHYEEDVNAALDELRGPTVVIGHSMGGVLAERVRAARADVVATAFLASSPLRPSLQAVAGVLRRRPWSMLRGQIAGDGAALKHAFASFFFSPRLAESERAALEARMDEESPLALKDIFRRAAIVPADDDRRPALVIAGEEDWSIPTRDHRELAARYRAPLVVCPGAHDLMLDADWEATAAAIHDWIGTWADVEADAA